MTATTPGAASRPLQWRSAATLGDAAAELAPAWAAWCGRWGFGAPATAATNAWEATADTAAAAWEALDASGGALLALGTGPRGGLRDALFARGEATAASAIADEVAQRCLADLRACLAGAFAGAGDAAPAAAAPDPADLRRWSGAVQFVLSATAPGGTAVAVVVHAPAAAARIVCRGAAAARPSTPRSGLASVAEALADRIVAFELRLEPLTLTLGNLQGLRVGDVLALPHRLDQPLLVAPAGSASDAASFCGAYLGARGGRRAAELVALAAPTSSRSVQ